MRKAIAFFILPVLLLGSCTMKPAGSTGMFTPFVPPTLQPTAAEPTGLPGSTPEPGVTVTSESGCMDSLIYLADLTVQDGTVVAPGATMDKRWQVQNTGTCNWGEGYTLRLIAGPDLGAEPEQALYPARAGSEASLRLVFTAPGEPGPYRSVWQAHNPEGQPFGDPIYIDIIVQAVSPTP